METETQTRWVWIDKCYPAYGSAKYKTADDINLVVTTEQAKYLGESLTEAANQSLTDVKIRISRKPSKGDKKTRIAVLFEI
jgi:hypothetical protein